VLVSGSAVVDRAAGDLLKWQGLPTLEQDAATQPVAKLCQWFYCSWPEMEIARSAGEAERSGGVMSSQESHPMVRTVASTQSEMTEIILPNDTNMLGNLLGGRLMHFIDVTGAMAAYRHARTHVVTASMDHIDFIQPVRLGDLVTLKSSVNRAFTSSMEVGVKVWAENTRTGAVSHVASAYLVFVAVDEHGRLQKVPQLQPETPDEVRRYEDALLRRQHRERESVRRKEARLVTAALNDAGAIEP
jgi:acyl-CoA hydrolase